MTTDATEIAGETKTQDGKNHVAVAGDGLAFLQYTRGSTVSVSDVTLFVLDADGAEQNAVTLVDDANVGTSPILAALPSGGFVVAVIVTEDADHIPKIFRLDASGALIGTTTLDAVPYSTLQALTGDAEGGFVLVLRDETADLSDPEELYGLKFAPEGGLEGAFAINQAAEGLQMRADAAYLAGGDLMTVWEDNQPGKLGDIAGQAFDPSGETAPPTGPKNLKKTGTGKDDVLKGKGGDDVLKGKGGSDKLIGKDGDDRLFGGGGKDKLFGGDGSDILDGGKGKDLLVGGAEDDEFRLRMGDFNVIKDFESGLDRITVLKGASSFAEISVIDKGDDALLKIGKAKLARLKDTEASEIDASDFIF